MYKNSIGILALDSSSGVTGYALSFIGNGQTLGSCQFYLSKFGTLAGPINAKIYAHTGTYGTTSKPTGAALATSDNLTNLNTIPTYSSGELTDFSLRTFTFSGVNNIVLTNGTNYCLSIEDSVDGGADNIIFGYDFGFDFLYSGNMSKLTSGTWAVFNAATNDMFFYLYDNSTPYSSGTSGLSTTTNITSITH